MALDKKSGKVLWEREAKYEKLETIHNIGSHAQCSPASDGERIVSFFGSSGLYCYSIDGEQLWHVPMGPFNDEFGASSSPLIVEDRVIVGQDHDTGSFLASFDKRSGKEIWRKDRSEFSRNASTPCIWTVDGKKQIVVAGTLRVCGYDWDTGSELWTVRGLSRVVCMTPVMGPDNLLIVAGWSAGGDPGERLSLEPFEKVVDKVDTNRNGTFESDEVKEGPLQSRFKQADRNKDTHVTKAEYEEFQNLFDLSQNAVLAIQPGAKGDATSTHVAWKFGRFIPFCSSPLYHDGRVYLIKDGGIFTCLDAKTGAVKKTGRVAGTGAYYASPVVGDKKIFLLSEKGELSVVSAEDSWQVLHSADFGEAGYATPAIVDGRIYLRTNQHLYCIGLAERNG
jgi:outer membrane protein assembly factor BamB